LPLWTAGNRGLVLSQSVGEAHGSLKCLAGSDVCAGRAKGVVAALKVIAHQGQTRTRSRLGSQSPRYQRMQMTPVFVRDAVIRCGPQHLGGKGQATVTLHQEPAPNELANGIG
jgi:hypothetical protein